MRAGLLNEWVVFQRPEEQQDQYGAISHCWIDHLRTKAQVKSVKTSSLIDSNEVGYPSSIEFIIRYKHNIGERMRIVYQGQYYRVISVLKDRKTQATTIQAAQVYE